jgi:hypothetical protein
MLTAGRHWTEDVGYDCHNQELKLSAAPSRRDLRHNSGADRSAVLRQAAGNALAVAVQDPNRNHFVVMIFPRNTEGGYDFGRWSPCRGFILMGKVRLEIIWHDLEFELMLDK